MEEELQAAKLTTKKMQKAQSSTNSEDELRSELEKVKAKLAAATQDYARNDQLEKKVEKLQLNVEDLNHEVAREVKSSRNAEKTSSSYTIQLAEAKEVHVVPRL